MARKRDPFRVGPWAFLSSGEPANFFRAWRDYRGMTQEEVAKSLGTNASAISKYELGEIGYTQRVLQALADIYVTRPYELLKGPPVDAESPVSDLIELPEDEQMELLASLQGLLMKVKRVKR